MIIIGINIKFSGPETLCDTIILNTIKCIILKKKKKKDITHQFICTFNKNGSRRYGLLLVPAEDFWPWPVITLRGTAPSMDINYPT